MEGLQWIRVLYKGFHVSLHLLSRIKHQSFSDYLWKLRKTFQSLGKFQLHLFWSQHSFFYPHYFSGKITLIESFLGWHCVYNEWSSAMVFILKNQLILICQIWVCLAEQNQLISKIKMANLAVLYSLNTLSRFLKSADSTKSDSLRNESDLTDQNQLISKLRWRSWLYSILYIGTQDWEKILKLMDLSSTVKKVDQRKKAHQSRAGPPPEEALLPSVASVVNRKWSHRDGHQNPGMYSLLLSVLSTLTDYTA